MNPPSILMAHMSHNKANIPDGLLFIYFQMEITKDAMSEEYSFTAEMPKKLKVLLKAIQITGKSHDILYIVSFTYLYRLFYCLWIIIVTPRAVLYLYLQADRFSMFTLKLL